VLQKVADGVDLMPAEASILALIKQINEQTPPTEAQNSIPGGDVSSGEEQLENVVKGSTQNKGKRVRQEGSRRQERLEASRNALMSWHESFWEANFSDSNLRPEVLLPDTVLTKLASRARIKMIADIKKEIPEWGWVSQYGETLLKLLEPIDSAWHEDNERKKEEKKSKQAKQSAERKAQREENRLIQARHNARLQQMHLFIIR
jgi:hypothetical protein